MSVPFLAPEPGLLPQDGNPVIEGIALPAGRRMRPEFNPAFTDDLFWCTDEQVHDWPSLCRSLAQLSHNGVVAFHLLVCDRSPSAGRESDLC